MNQLSNKQIRHLRSLAHDRKPVVIVGEKGITDNLVEEVKNALETHELIKVKVRAEEREEREQMITILCQKTQAAQIQRVGHIVTLFKRNKDPKIALPKS